MTQMILYECKKHFIKPFLAAAVMIFLLADVFRIGGLYREKAVFSIAPEFQAVYDELFEVYGGPISAGKIRALMARYRPVQAAVSSRTADTEYDPDSLIYNAHSDEIFLRWCFVDPMRYAWEYEKNAAQIGRWALENAEIYRRAGNDFGRRESERIAAQFAGRSIPELQWTEMYQYFLQYDFSVFFVLLIVIAALANVFVMEKETGMDLLLATTVRGCRRSAAAKLAASFLFAAAVCFLFWIWDLLVFGAFFGGFEGGGCPLYAVKYFEFTPLSLSLLQYGFLSMALKTAGIMVLGLLVLLLSCLCGNVLLSFLGSVSAAGVCLCVYAASLPPLLDGVLLWNPVCLLVNRELFGRTEFLNFAGRPVPEWAAALAAAGAITVLTAGFVLRKSRRSCL